MSAATLLPHVSAESADRREVDRLAEAIGIVVGPVISDDVPAWRAAGRVARASLGGVLPVRYATDGWHNPLQPRLGAALLPGIRILDVGAGARPMVGRDERPEGVTYVGLDVDGEELRKAPEGSYDSMVVGDITRLDEDLVGGFDLVLSWLTMEHVADVPAALHTLSRYQRPGGRFLDYLAGRWSAHACLNRVVPHRVARAAMRRLMGRDPDTVFRAHYDRCTYDGLRAAADVAWSEALVLPAFTGSWYFDFSPPLRASYLAYEEWAYRSGRRNLASYYLIDAIR